MKRILSSLSRGDRPVLSIDTRQRSYGTLQNVPEEDFDIQRTHVNDETDRLDWEDQWELELEERGLYRGTWTRLVALYTVVPLTSFLVLLALSLVPTYFFPVTPSPLPELIVSVSLYSLLHVLRLPLFQILPFPWIHRLLITLLTLLLRLLPLVVLDIPKGCDHHPRWDQPAFTRVWWVALGWGAAEVVAGIWQGYELLALYKDVLVGEPPSPESELGIGMLPPSHSQSQQNLLQQSREDITNLKLSRSTTRSEQELALQIERDLEELGQLKGREEVEEVYGMPFIRIPVFISCLVRVNALIHTLGLTLLLSAAYIRSSLSTPSSSYSETDPAALVDPPANTALLTTVAAVFVIHFGMVSLHSPPLLAKVGVHTASYLGFLVGLGCLFAGMGLWEAVE